MGQVTCISIPLPFPRHTETAVGAEVSLGFPSRIAENGRSATSGRAPHAGGWVKLLFQLNIYGQAEPGLEEGARAAGYLGGNRVIVTGAKLRRGSLGVRYARVCLSQCSSSRCGKSER